MEKSKVIQGNVSYLEKLFENLDQNFKDQDDSQKLIPAAVLILLYEKNSEIYIVLTKRSMDLKIHK